MRDTLFVNQFLRGNKGSNPIAGDDGCEEQNRREKELPEVQIGKTETRSEHADEIHQAKLTHDFITGVIDEGGNRTIEKSVPPAEMKIRARLLEVIRKAKLFEFVPGRKISAINEIATMELTTELGNGEVQSSHGPQRRDIQDLLATVYPREEPLADDEADTGPASDINRPTCDASMLKDMQILYNWDCPIEKGNIKLTKSDVHAEHRYAREQERKKLVYIRAVNAHVVSQRARPTVKTVLLTETPSYRVFVISRLRARLAREAKKAAEEAAAKVA